MLLLKWGNSVLKAGTRERKVVKKQAVCSRWPTGELEQMIRVQKFLHKSKVTCTDE
jgi:hypothetical protein